MVGYQGSFSIQELDRRYGSRWRAGRNKEIQFYFLRLEIIKEIARLGYFLERISDAGLQYNGCNTVKTVSNAQLISSVVSCYAARLESEREGGQISS